MSINKLALISYILFALIFTSCGDDDESIKPDPFEGCCAEEMTVYMVGSSSIYLPNAFTPNDDGINDLFIPQVGAGIDSIHFFTITDIQNKIIFSDTDFDVSENLPAWDSRNLDGLLIEGIFTYRLQVESDDGLETIEGQVCSITCNGNQIPDQFADNCQFPNQHDGMGGVDITISPSEDDCF